MTTRSSVVTYDQAEACVHTLLRFIGEDPDRDGVRDTPRRVVKALLELTSGIDLDPAAVLTTSFDSSHDQMIAVSGIEFASVCEHHLLPFVGTVDVAYIPANGAIVGLSKLPRLVEVLARRPQVQERLTDQIAETLAKAVANEGVAVRVRARHACAGVRGVRQANMTMTTQALLGAFRSDAATRAEWTASLPA